MASNNPGKPAPKAKPQPKTPVSDGPHVGNDESTIELTHAEVESFGKDAAGRAVQTGGKNPDKNPSKKPAK